MAGTAADTPKGHYFLKRRYGRPVYGRESAGGVCPWTKAGLPCDVIVTLLEVKPGEVAVMTLAPE
jgi:hypothetical protein